jgi:hypothetical protein
VNSGAPEGLAVPVPLIALEAVQSISSANLKYKSKKWREDSNGHEELGSCPFAHGLFYGSLLSFSYVCRHIGFPLSPSRLLFDFDDFFTNKGRIKCSFTLLF